MLADCHASGLSCLITVYHQFSVVHREECKFSELTESVGRNIKYQPTALNRCLQRRRLISRMTLKSSWHHQEDVTRET